MGLDYKIYLTEDSEILTSEGVFNIFDLLNEKYFLLPDNKTKIYVEKVNDKTINDDIVRIELTYNKFLELNKTASILIDSKTYNSCKPREERITLGRVRNRDRVTSFSYEITNFGKSVLDMPYEKGFFDAQRKTIDIVPGEGRKEYLDITKVTRNPLEHFTNGKIKKTKRKLFNFYEEGTFSSIGSITPREYTKDTIVQYLVGFFDGLGSLRTVGDEITGICVYSTFKYEIFRHISNLLLCLGIKSRVQSKLPERYEEIHGRVYKCRSYYYIIIDKVGMDKLKILGGKFRKNNFECSEKHVDLFQDYRVLNFIEKSNIDAKRQVYSLSSDKEFTALINGVTVIS